MKTKLILPVVILSLMYSCEENPDRDFRKLVLDVSNELPFNDCLFDSGDDIFVCLDSVRNDSRCPTGVQCIWEGNAEVKFSLGKQGAGTIPFILNTNLRFRNDTIINGYKFSLTGLDPYPIAGHHIKNREYIARLKVEKI